MSRPDDTKCMKAVTRRLVDIIFLHSFACGWIIFAQVQLRLISPIASIFLMHLTVLSMAELSWRLQANTMQIWHPVVQLCFCVSRMVHGLIAIMAAVTWAKVLCLYFHGLV